MKLPLEIIEKILKYNSQDYIIPNIFNYAIFNIKLKPKVIYQNYQIDLLSQIKKLESKSNFRFTHYRDSIIISTNQLYYFSYSKELIRENN